MIIFWEGYYITYVVNKTKKEAHPVSTLEVRQT